MKRHLILLATASLMLPAAFAAVPQEQTLHQTLRQSLAERVPMPLAFSTRDTAFTLSLPTDEPAAVYVQLTVARNGKVREKLTRVNANHIAAYVAPAFVAAAKGLRVDPALCARMTGKDTALTITVPLDYQCVLDTMSKAMPSMEPEFYPFYHTIRGVPETTAQREKAVTLRISIASSVALQNYRYYTEPTRIWYYVVFPAGQVE